MKLGCLVRKVDDVAEVLIFDVVLGTRRRRAIAAVLAALAGLALYTFSGFLLAPALYMETRKIDSAPVIDDKTLSIGSGKAVEVAAAGVLKPEDVEDKTDERGILEDGACPRAPASKIYPESATSCPLRWRLPSVGDHAWPSTDPAVASRPAENPEGPGRPLHGDGPMPPVG